MERNTFGERNEPKSERSIIETWLKAKLTEGSSPRVNQGGITAREGLHVLRSVKMNEHTDSLSLEKVLPLIERGLVAPVSLSQEIEPRQKAVLEGKAALAEREGELQKLREVEVALGAHDRRTGTVGYFLRDLFFPAREEARRDEQTRENLLDDLDTYRKSISVLEGKIRKGTNGGSELRLFSQVEGEFVKITAAGAQLLPQLEARHSLLGSQSLDSFVEALAKVHEQLGKRIERAQTLIDHLASSGISMESESSRMAVLGLAVRSSSVEEVLANAAKLEEALDRYDFPKKTYLAITSSMAAADGEFEKRLSRFVSLIEAMPAKERATLGRRGVVLAQLSSIDGPAGTVMESFEKSYDNLKRLGLHGGSESTLIRCAVAFTKGDQSREKRFETHFSALRRRSMSVDDAALTSLPLSALPISPQDGLDLLERSKKALLEKKLGNKWDNGLHNCSAIIASGPGAVDPLVQLVSEAAEMVKGCSLTQSGDRYTTEKAITVALATVFDGLSHRAQEEVDRGVDDSYAIYGVHHSQFAEKPATGATGRKNDDDGFWDGGTGTFELDTDMISNILDMCMPRSSIDHGSWNEPPATHENSPAGYSEQSSHSGSYPSGHEGSGASCDTGSSGHHGGSSSSCDTGSSGGASSCGTSSSCSSGSSCGGGGGGCGGGGGD